MMTPEQAREALSDCRLMVVSEKTGLHYSTLKQIRNNESANPTAATLKKISDYFESREKARKSCGR